MESESGGDGECYPGYLVHIKAVSHRTCPALQEVFSILKLGEWAAGIKAVTGILIPKNNIQKLSQNWEKSRFSIILVEKTAIFVIF